MNNLGNMIAFEWRSWDLAVLNLLLAMQPYLFFRSLILEWPSVCVSVQEGASYREV